jgi:hypothetical protein
MLVPVGAGDPVSVNYGWFVLDTLLPWILIFLLILWECVTARRMVSNWRQAARDEENRQITRMRGRN